MAKSNKAHTQRAAALLRGETPPPIVVPDKPVEASPRKAPVEPTPEQIGAFEKQDVTDKRADGSTITIGKVYRRKPLFETMAKDKASGISADGLAALRYYRARYEETGQSLTRCALDADTRGSGIPTCLPPLLVSDHQVRLCEAGVGTVLDTLRAVALEDRSYSDVAMARFGSRKQRWIKVDAKEPYVEKLVPISGRHRELIRTEFLQALQRLTATVTGLKESDRRLQPPVPALPPPAEVDPEYLDDAGHMKPWHEIAEVIRSRSSSGTGT